MKYKTDFNNSKMLIVLTLCAVMLYCLAACSSAPASPSPEKLIALADNYLDSGDYASALEQYLEYIDIEPEEAYGYISAADAYIGMDDTAKAISILEDGYEKTENRRILRKLDELEALMDSAESAPSGSSAQASAPQSSPSESAAAPAQEPAVAPVEAFPAPTSAQPSESSIFPIQYAAYGNSYSLTSYNIGTNDDGNTTVQFLGSGYQIISFRNGQWAIPAVGECTSGGRTYSAGYYSVDGIGITFIFGSYFEPETITVTNGDTGEVIVSFNVEDHPPG